MPRSYRKKRTSRLRRTYSMPSRRLYRRRGGKRTKRTYLRSLRRLDNRFVRPNYTIIGADNVGFSYTAWNGWVHAYTINYYGSIGVGTASNQRTGDTIKACPGGYLKFHISLNPNYSKYAQLREIGCRVRMVTFRIMEDNMASFPLAQDVVPQLFTSGDYTMAVRVPDNMKKFKVLSDKVYTLTEDKPYAKRFVKHKWKGTVEWDRTSNNPKRGFYYTYVFTMNANAGNPFDTPPDITPITGDLVFPVVGSFYTRTTWLNTH